VARIPGAQTPEIGTKKMRSLAVVSRAEALVLIGGFWLVIVWKLLTGGIRLNQLLSGDRSNGDTYFSWGRAQFLAVSLFVAGQYLLRVTQDPSKLPDIPNGVLALLGGSAAVYAGEKAQAMLFDQPRNSTRRNR
jgi:hypothetical protein